MGVNHDDDDNNNRFEQVCNLMINSTSEDNKGRGRPTGDGHLSRVKI